MRKINNNYLGTFYIEELENREEQDRVKLYDSDENYLDYLPLERYDDTDPTLEEQYNGYVEMLESFKTVPDLSEWRFASILEYYEDDRIPTKEELEYLDKLGLNFTEFAAHYEVVTLDAPDGEICTVDSTCDLEEALKWYNEEINGFVYIQLVDHDSMFIEILKCNF